MSFLYKDLLFDFGIVSTILVVSHIVRSKIKLFQYIYIPSPIIAGIICILLGWQFLDILPFSTDNNGNIQLSSYPTFLVVVLFSTLYMGKKFTKIKILKTIKNIGDTFFFNAASLVGQYGFSLLFGIMVLAPLFPELHAGFGLLLPAGFIGGHGTAAAIGNIFEKKGLEGALSIAYASATIGILIGIFGGIILINIATRCGWTKIISSIQKMPKSIKTGFLNKKEQISIGKETTSSVSLDTLTWHISLILSVTIASFYFSNLIQELISKNFLIPVFCLSILIGLISQKILNLIGVGDYIDRKIINKIGSLATDYLIIFGISSITLNVLTNFALPIILMFLFGTLFSIFFMFFIGKRINRNFWFERSIVMFGWNTGSIAISIVLLKIMDPNMKTSIMEDFGFAYIFISPIEITIITVLPSLIINNIILLPSLILIFLFLFFIILSKKFVGWSKKSI